MEYNFKNFLLLFRCFEKGLYISHVTVSMGNVRSEFLKY